MRRLLLLRHAKAVAKDAKRDFERVLSGRGRQEMAAVAQAMAAAAIQPDLALVSPAARTRETWAMAGLAEVPVRFEPSIYEASVETLLGLVHALPDEAGSAMLVGHNPGFEELAALLAAPKPAREIEALQAGLPTAALVVLGFPVASWSAVAAGKGRVERFLTPASLGSGDA